MSPQCHLHPSRPLLAPAEPPAVTQIGFKIRVRGSGRGKSARGAEEEHPGPVEGGSTIRGGDRPVPTPRAPSRTLGGRAGSPALPAGPVAAVAAVPVATDSPGGSLGTAPSPPPASLGRGRAAAPVGATSPAWSRRQREGGGSGRAEDGGERFGVTSGGDLKRGPVELGKESFVGPTPRGRESSERAFPGEKKERRTKYRYILET